MFTSFKWVSQDSRSLYVSKDGRTNATGTIYDPFLTIQAAIDFAATLVPASSTSSPVVINIGVGTYTENLIIKIPGLILSGDSDKEPSPFGVVVLSETGSPLTVTNATLASLAAYDISGNYSDLVNDGAGPMGIIFTNIRFRGLLANTTTARILGVKGDATADTTNFGNDTVKYIPIKFCECLIQKVGGGSNYSIHVKNAGLFVMQECMFQGSIQLDNTAYVTTVYCPSPVNMVHGWDTTSVDGYSAGTLSTSRIDFSRIGSLQLTGGAKIESQFSRFAAVNLDGTATAAFHNCYMSSTLAAEANVALTIQGTTVIGATTIDAGAGVVTETDCTFAGLVTDASDKLKHAGEDRYGTYTEAAGAGARAVAFTPNFPNGATINVQISFEGAAVTTFKISDGTIAHTGFTLDTGGNGKFHWYAHKVK